MVAGGLGCTLMPKHLPIMPGILTRPIVDPVVTRTVSVVTRAGRRYCGPVLQTLEAARDLSWPDKPSFADAG